MPNQTVFDAARQLSQRTASVEDKVAKVDPEPDRPVNNNAPSKDTSAVTSQNVGRTERRPTKGEGKRAFGAPTARPPAVRSENDRETIRAEQAAQVSRMNERSRQSTDSNN